MQIAHTFMSLLKIQKEKKIALISLYICISEYILNISHNIL